MKVYDWIEELSNKKIIIWGASIGGNQAYKYAYIIEDGIYWKFQSTLRV